MIGVLHGYSRRVGTNPRRFLDEDKPRGPSTRRPENGRVIRRVCVIWRLWGRILGTTTKCPPPGKHELSVTVHIEIFNGSMNGPGTVTLEYQCDRTMIGSFEVVATKPANLIQPVFDPKLAAAMKAAVTPQAFRYSLKDHMLEGTIQFNNPPMNLAYEVIARYGGKEHRVGEVTYHAPAGTSGYSTSGSVPDPPPATADVILRPSEKAAVDTVDIYTYWNQEMVFPNVPVARH